MATKTERAPNDGDRCSGSPIAIRTRSSTCAGTGRKVCEMSFQRIEKPEWQTLFDATSRILEGKFVEIEVIGLSLGDQFEVEWLPVNGITYDPKDDALYIYIAGVDRDLDHMIPSPHEIYIEFGSTGLSQVVVVDSEGNKQIVRFRAPLELPPHIEDDRTERGSPPGRVE